MGQGGNGVDHGHAIADDAPESGVRTGVIEADVEIAGWAPVVGEIDEPLARGAVCVTPVLRHRYRPARVRDARLVWNHSPREQLGRPGIILVRVRRRVWIDRADKTAALNDKSGNGPMDEAGRYLVRRRIKFEKPPLVYVF